jgi:hypothetical protein
MGPAKDRMSGHGFRSMARNLFNVWMEET